MNQKRNSLSADSIHAVEREIPCSCGKTPHAGSCDVMTALYSHSFREAKRFELRHSRKAGTK